MRIPPHLEGAGGSALRALRRPYTYVHKLYNIVYKILYSMILCIAQVRQFAPWSAFGEVTLCAR